MNVKKPASRRSLTSDLARVDSHALTAAEYAELPELTDDMLARAQINKGGGPCQQIRASCSPSDCPLTLLTAGKQPALAGKRAWQNG
jgi:hypothetical protein